MSLEELTKRQIETGDEFQRLIRNYKRDSPDRKTAEYLQKKLPILDQLWESFEETDNSIRIGYGDRLDHNYFKKNYYDAIQREYEWMRQDITSRLEALHPADLETSATDPQQKQDTALGELETAELKSKDKLREEDIVQNLPPTVKNTGAGAFPKTAGILPLTMPSTSLAQGTNKTTSLIRKQHSIMSDLQRLLLSLRTQGETQSIHFYQVKIHSIQNYWSEIQNMHYQIWEQTDNPSNMGYDIQAYFNLEENVQQELIKLNEMMESTTVPANVLSMPASSNTFNHNNMVRLPKIVLPTFDGDYLKWRQYRDLFTELVHNQNINSCQKMWYLKTSLSGEAEKLIRHLTTSEANYTAAWKIINERFENTRLLVNALLSKLLSQSAISIESASAIKSLHDTTQECLLALENLGVPTEHWDPLVLYILIKKLDKTTHALWEQSLDQPRTLQQLKSFMQFLETRFQSLEALGIKGRPAEDKKTYTQRTLTSTVNSGSVCPACKGTHKLFACQRFLQMTPSQRTSLVKRANICFNCLRPGHTSEACTSSSCTKCSRRHNTLLHISTDQGVRRKHTQVSTSKGQEASSITKTTAQVNVAQSADTSISLTTKTDPKIKGYVLLSTAIVKLSNGRGTTTECRAILDSGSQVNLITERMVKKLQLTTTPELMCIEGIGQRQQQTQRRVNILLQSRINGFSSRLEAHVLPRIISPQPSQAITITNWPIPNNIQLADPRFNQPYSIDLLIGAELYYSLLSVGQIRLGENLPTLQNTVFGWTAAGKIHSPDEIKVASCGICNEQDLDQQIEKFWKLEESLVSKNNFTAAEERCESHFNSTTRRDVNGRFVVKLPFNGDPSVLGESKDIAFQRLLAVEKRLVRQPELRDQYIRFMNEYINLGHMKEVNFSEIQQPYYFMPHHSVIKPDSSSTKLRVVFDASAKTASNASLNDILSTGPTIQDDVFSILLRFRMPRFVFTADIEKMYRQVRVDEADQKYQLIWWRVDPNQKVKCFQLCTVTYGTTSAPYLATKCLQRLSSEEAERRPLGAAALARDFYVDDVLTGSDSLATTLEMQLQLNQILDSAGFKLRKWCANHPRLLENIPERDQELQLDFSTKSEDNIKAVGLTWLPKSDEFIIKTAWEERKKVTKRTALSDIAHIFDPLGMMGPVIVTAKIFLQKLWTLRLDWDAALPQELHSSWIEYREGLKALNSIKFPRHVFSHKTSKSMQLHIFADASEKAYGAAAYVRSIDKHNIITVRLLCAKSRVAPVKQITLPRLELCAAKLAAELANRIKRDLNSAEETIHFWTDSEIVLAWINSSSSSLHTFVANRVATIQRLSRPQQWRHVGSKDNPADILSRGISPEKLGTCNLWFYGPLFLHGRQEIWPTPYTKKLIDKDPERRQCTASTVTTDSSEHFINSINHQNSFYKLQRITAYILRFTVNTRRQNQGLTKNISLNIEELDNVEAIIIKLMQEQEFGEDIQHLKQFGEVARNSSLISLTPFLDEKGVIRVGGRLEASNLSYNAKHPMLLPPSHEFTKLLINDIHKSNYHVGSQALLSITRQKFWPLKGKTLARSVVQRCVQCTKAKPKFLSQLMGNLPPDRVQPARPFINVGVDFCGPVFTHFKIRGKRPQKSYIAVFCCFTTKATHFEVVSDLSSQGFIGALKRFIGRRGRCKTIYCDNATNFVGAKNQLEEVKDMITSDKEREAITTACSSKGIDFRFIPPRAPHFGGLWEAAVKSAKSLLQRVLASASLTYEELETVIIEIEAILNSRPITPISTDPNDLTALTPGHFLIGEPLTSSIDPRAQPQNGTLLTRWKLVLHIKNQFWHRWSNEYLNQLQHRYKWKQKCQNIKAGDMVIIKEDNTPPLKWSLGRVIKVIKGTDGLVRVADIRTSSGTLRRAIHRLAPLPLENEISDNKDLDSEGPQQQDNIAQSISNETPHTSKEDQGAINNPRKKQRQSLGTALVTLLITCLVLPAVKGSPVTIMPFKSRPGIYFENLGVTNIISSEWHLIAYYNMDPYWNEFSAFSKCINQLDSLCNSMTERQLCSQITHQFKHLHEELSKGNELLSPPTDKKRSKRGALNIVGNVANALFGVLDSEYAEKMSQTIDNIDKNEHFLLNLLRNQTSIIEATTNIMERQGRAISKQLHELENHIDQINNQINGIREEMFQERLNQLFLSVGIQTMLTASNFLRIQESILDVLIHTHQGKISPRLISPSQMQGELIHIRNNLPSSLRLPMTQDDVLKHYNLMNIEGRVVGKHIIFRIRLPLLTTDDFELFKLTPVPVLVNDTAVAIRPSYPFLIINLHRDLYYPLTKQELMSCISITEDKHLCKQTHPTYHKGAIISNCEVSLINHLPQPDSCHIMKTERGPHWIQLHNINQWIYVLEQKTTINIVCGDNVTEETIDGTGILKIQEDCVIKQPLLTIRGHKVIQSTSRMSYLPTSNLMDMIVPEKLAPALRHTSHHQPDLAELESIKRQLAQLPSDLPENIHAHDTHQFVISYTGFFLIMIIIIYLFWKSRTLASSRPTSQDDKEPEENRPEDQKDDERFTVNI